MIEIIIVTFLLTNSLFIVVHKYKGFEILDKFFSKRSKFLHKMVKCRFCMFHHISIFSLVIYAFVFGFEFSYFFIPFCSASVDNVLMTFYERD